jgi:hypothetical protein
VKAFLEGLDGLLNVLSEHIRMVIAYTAWFTSITILIIMAVRG